MRYRPGARLDPGQVQDRRAGGGRGVAVGGIRTVLVVGDPGRCDRFAADAL
jgi:uridine phosphorylase